MAQDVKILFTGSFGLDLHSGSTFEAKPFPDFGTVSPSGSITSASIASGLTLTFSDNTISTGSLAVENGPCSGSLVYFSWPLLPGATPPPTPAPVTPPPTPAPATPSPTPAPAATPPTTPAPAAPTTPSPVAPPPTTPAPALAPVTPSPTPAPATTPPPTPSPTPAPVTPAPTTPAPVTPPPTPAPTTPAPTTPAPTAPCHAIIVDYNSGYPYGCCGTGDNTGTFYFNSSTVNGSTRMYSNSLCTSLTSGTYYVSDDNQFFHTFVNGVRVGGSSSCSSIDCEQA